MSPRRLQPRIDNVSWSPPVPDFGTRIVAFDFGAYRALIVSELLMFFFSCFLLINVRACVAWLLAVFVSLFR